MPVCLYVCAKPVPGCPWQEGDIVPLECEVPCRDLLLQDGPCAGALLNAIYEECVEYDPEASAAAATADQERAKESALRRRSPNPKRVTSDEVDRRRVR
jgi:hypothetical protein